MRGYISLQDRKTKQRLRIERIAPQISNTECV